MNEQDIFAAAIKLAGNQRSAFLAAACDHDVRLREQVDALLAAHDESGGLLPKQGDWQLDATCLAKDQAAPGMLIDVADFGQTRRISPMAKDQAAPGMLIDGRYKLLESIGEGGMGTVWVAEQTQPVRRKVALKLIKAGMDSKTVLARFEAERQALAVMDHPNIAKVLDGGLTEAGRPYFVMEYVKGLPITEYCDATRLSVSERLNLFVQVCNAVQHAHQKGIIHRDLKPSNILVAPYDDKPVPKVIDFGLAKAMHQSLTERTLHTAHETVLGTPLYMSPEQAQLNNMDVDTRSDIYSLGVLLYELLTGTTPLEKQRFKQAAWDEIRRIIREEEPQRPSTRLSSASTLPSLAASRHTEPARLTKLIRGELDWIVMKSLEKDRSRRYETANGFAMDIQRYLAGETVLAAPPGTAYRVRKFVRKHRVGLTAVTVILLLIGTGVGAVMTVQAQANRQLADEKDKVQSRFELTLKAIAIFHTGVSDDLLLKRSQFKELRTRLLKEAAGFYGDLEKLLEGQTDVRSRRALSKAYFELGDLTEKIGSKSQALSVHRKGLAVRKELASVAGADVEAKLAVLKSLLRVGQLLAATGDNDGALSTLEELRNLAEQLDRTDSTVAVQAITAQEYFASGCVLFETGKAVEAQAAFVKAIAIQQSLAQFNPEIAEFRYQLVESHIAVGRNLRDKLSKPAEALTAFDEARAISQKLADAYPKVTDYQYQLGLSYNHIGQSFVFTEGNSAAALAAYEQAQSIFQKLVAENPTVNDFEYLLGIVLRSIGRVLRENAKLAEAFDFEKRSLEKFQELVDANPDVIEYQMNLAHSLSEIGWLQSQSGKPEDAVSYFTREEVVWRHLSDPKGATPYLKNTLANCQTNLADVLRRLKRRDKARAACESALAARQLLVKEHDQVSSFRSGLAETYLRIGQIRSDMDDPSGASSAWRQAITLYRKLTSTSAEVRFFRACCHACLSGLSAQPEPVVSVEEGVLERKNAMNWLRQAVSAGYNNPDQYRDESALDPIRDTKEFKELMAELENKVEQQKKP